MYWPEEGCYLGFGTLRPETYTCLRRSLTVVTLSLKVADGAAPDRTSNGRLRAPSPATCLQSGVTLEWPPDRLRAT
jgi:hypothetical protein